MKLEPFRVEVPDADLADLRDRLDRARWPDAVPGSGWELGTDIESLRAVCDRWRTDYDWRSHEAWLNGHDQYLTDTAEGRMHVLHARSPEPDALPLVLVHGWPSTMSEFVHVVGPLVDPVAHGGDAADAFEVVAVSLPGFGFGGPTTTRGWHGERMADEIIAVCRALGLSRYGVYGGDAGAYVAECVAVHDSESVAGVHFQLGGVRIAGMARANPVWMVDLSEREQRALAALDRYETDGSAYAAVNTTRPQTIAYGLNDSPVGQAAWIIEKFHAWTDCEGPDGVRDLTRAVAVDDVLHIVTTYWLTGTAGSAGRFYAETVPHIARSPLPPVEVPTGCSVFPGDIVITSRRWADLVYPNIVHWTEMPRGGHFGALEAPELLVEDMRAFFAALR